MPGAYEIASVSNFMINIQYCVAKCTSE